MRKRLLFTLMAMNFLALAQAQDALTGNATITIDVSKMVEKDGRYILLLQSEKQYDSTVPKNDKLVFKEILPEPQIASLRFYPSSDIDVDYRKKNPTRKNIFYFYITPGNTNITVNDSLGASIISNPNIHQKKYISFQKQNEIFEKENIAYLVQKYRDAVRQGNKDSISKAQGPLFIANEKKENVIWKAFIKQNASTSPVALSILNQYAGPTINTDTLKMLYDLLSNNFKKLPSATKIKDRINIVQSIAIGKIAPDFTQNDTSGHSVSLKDFRGKYVLIDFWASWCGPCRAENPNVVSAFNKFKDKNFTILGVSFDQNKDSWLNAIHKDGLGWTHVSDLQYWKNAIGRIYDIHFIPQNVLIDPKGTIIAKNIGGKQLQEKLASILGE